MQKLFHIKGTGLLKFCHFDLNFMYNEWYGQSNQSRHN